MDPNAANFDPRFVVADPSALYGAAYPAAGPPLHQDPYDGVAPGTASPVAQAGYVNPYNNFYPQQEQQQQQQHYDQGYQAQSPTAYGTVLSEPTRQEAVVAGSLFPVESLQTQFYGASVNALAYDTAYEAVFVASDTQALSRGRFNHRASMLVNHSTVDGMLYSSIAGHPEAPTKVLKKIYDIVYSTTVGSPPSFARRKVPNHAFRPTYGGAEPGLPDFHMGINQLLPLGEGFVCSVSPSAVRIHSHGGLQTSDFHTEGMLCMTAHPSQTSSATHLSVGGVALGKDVSEQSGRSDVLCLDLWQGLRIIASYSTAGRGGRNTSTPAAAKIGVTAMATSHSRGSIVAGCSDGSVRILDDRLWEVAKLKSHIGGVVNLVVSEDGNLLATAGFGSRGSSTYPMYSFPDPNIYFYDLRFLGRGAMSHSFAGINGGPRFLSFLPPMEGQERNRLLAASGQVAGGMQVVRPFGESGSSDASDFVITQLGPGEAITAMDVQEDRVGLGTSKGNILQYRIAEYKERARRGRSSGVFVPPTSPNRELRSASPRRKPAAAAGKKILELPPFEPELPELSIDPATLLKGGDRRRGVNESTKPVFSSYTLAHNPTLTPIGDDGTARFGPLASSVMVASGENEVSDDFIAKSTPVDFVRTVPASELKLDLLEDHRPEWLKTRNKEEPLANPNKFLYHAKLYTTVYKESFTRFKKRGRRNRRDDGGDQGLLDIPSRYRLSLRPTHKTAAAFSHAEHNDSKLLPGWDYPPTMPNAFVPPVLMLLYFVPEARRALLRSQFTEKASFLGKKDGVVSELSFLFHRIDSLARYAMIFQSTGAPEARLGAWCPSNFVACLAAMPEAEQLQILDGSPAAVETPRRPEAFYRFLLYQIDKELGKGTNLKLMDNLGGVDFVSVNEFNSNSAPPTTSSTRAMTVELHYEPFLRKGNPKQKQSPSFGELLHHTLSRQTPLRAFNNNSGAFETIVQRKMAVSLPKLLSLSCACAGRKEEDGLFVWRETDLGQDHWLPETIEIEIMENGSVIVRELVCKLGTDDKEWVSYGDDESISAAVAGILAEREGIAQKLTYHLNAVVSLVRDDLDRNVAEDTPNHEDTSCGHHVLHVRIPRAYEKRIVKTQKDELEHLMSKPATPFGLINGEEEKESMRERVKYTESRLQDLEEEQSNEADGDWVLFNGFHVSRSSAEDARAFHVCFKEPCLVVFRCQESPEPKAFVEEQQFKVPADVVCTRSLTNNLRSNFFANQKPTTLPGEGDLVAFDAEFVSVQEEVSTLTESGSRVTIQEIRHAMARISAIACQTRTVIFDDFVLPQEPVADYLTRFSGIVEQDLNPKESQRHLISNKAAYLKLRCLVERGCVFVGHGLSRDFWTANLTVPASQVIDTVEIYHKPAQRYVSLRFLTNFVLKRDMQQEVHDSMEDATAAFELYQKAVELQQKGEFDELLDDLYRFGQKVEWKLGIE